MEYRRYSHGCWVEVKLSTLTCWGYYQIINLAVYLQTITDNVVLSEYKKTGFILFHISIFMMTFSDQSLQISCSLPMVNIWPFVGNCTLSKFHSVEKIKTKYNILYFTTSHKEKLITENIYFYEK